MSEPHLIAHKVRGSLAFDIAILIEGPPDRPDPCWLIPTSGHRAYPFWTFPLKALGARALFSILTEVPPMPEELQDHYSANDRKPKLVKPTIADKIDLEDLF